MCRRRSHLSGIAGTRAGRGSAISRFLKPRADSTPNLAANQIMDLCGVYFPDRMRAMTRAERERFRISVQREA
jgi:hypothetical protein